MQICGKTEDGLNVYKISDKVGVSEDGELLNIAGEISAIDKAFIVNVPNEFDFGDASADVYCKAHCLDLSNVILQNGKYKIDLVEETINGVSFSIENDEDEFDDEPEVFTYKDFWVFVNDDDDDFGYTITQEKEVPDAELTAEIEEEIAAIVSSLYYIVDEESYVSFEEFENSL